MESSLRLPKVFQTLNDKEMLQLTDIRWGLCHLVKEYGASQLMFRKSLIVRTALRNLIGVESFSGAGTIYCPYSIKTKWGSGKFYNARLLFKDKQYPNYIEKRYCFDNCYNFARLVGEANITECKVLSGIAFVKDIAILHSVIETADGWIVDFNYDLVMQKHLYESIFGFETLAELTSQEIFVKDKLINRYNKHIKAFGCGYKVFALNDLIDYAEQREEKTIDERWAIGNF